MNRELSAAQKYSDARQDPDQSVHSFNTYLATLEAQMPAYAEAHKATHFFTKLRPELRAALTNY